MLDSYFSIEKFLFGEKKKVMKINEIKSWESLGILVLGCLEFIL